MALSSHLINASVFDSENVSEMRLAAQLADIWRKAALAAAAEKPLM